MPIYFGDRPEPTVIITERIQRDGYVLKLTHEVPKTEEYRDYRLLGKDISVGWYGVLHTHLHWPFDYISVRDELNAEIGRITGISRDSIR